MAYYNLRTQISKGKYKGAKVGDLIKCIEGQNYLLKMHIEHYNVFLNPDVFRAIAEYARTKDGEFITSFDDVLFNDMLSTC